MIRMNGTPKPNDSWITPQWVLDLIGKDYYDPCPYNPEYADDGQHVDGLNTDWVSYSDWCDNRVFVNPAYSNPLEWVEKAILEHKYGATVIMLLKHDSSTRWYAKLHEAGAWFLPIQGRLTFTNTNPAVKEMRSSFPSVLVVLS